VDVAVDDVEPAGGLAVGLAAGRLPGLDRSQEALPQRKIGAALERVEHRVGDLGADDGVGGHDHVAVDAMTRPRPVPRAGSRHTQAGDVETAKLPALDVLVARGDLVENARRRIAVAQEIQTEMTETRIGAGLRDDGAVIGGHVDAARADRHLAGRDRDPEHAAALAPPDQREGHRSAQTPAEEVSDLERAGHALRDRLRQRHERVDLAGILAVDDVYAGLAQPFSVRPTLVAERVPPAESPATAMRAVSAPRSRPFSRSQRYAAKQSSTAAGNLFSGASR